MNVVKTENTTKAYAPPPNPWDAFIAMKTYYEKYHTSKEARAVADACNMLMKVLCISESGSGIGITAAYCEDFRKIEASWGRKPKYHALNKEHS